MKGNRIHTERTLIVGDARIQEGDSAYICFYRNHVLINEPPDGVAIWMYATLKNLYDDCALFATNGSQNGFILLPQSIIAIADKPPVADAEALLRGEFVAVENLEEKKGE